MNVKSILCDECELIMNDPITIPCGKTICQHHLDEFDEKFACILCNKEHQIPQNGCFCINQKIESKINDYFELNPFRKKIKDLFENLNFKIQDYDQINSDAYIYNYFQKIRLKVDLHREESIKEINDISEQILEEIKQKEEQCNSNKAEIVKESFSELKENVLPMWKQKLRFAQMNDDELNELSTNMKNHIKHIRGEIRK